MMETDDPRRYRVIEGDMFEHIGEVKADTVQLALIDPPYMVGSVSASEKDKIGPWGDLMNGARFFRDVIDAIRPKLTYDGCLWMFGNWRGLPSLYKGACDASWIPSGCLAWDKCSIGMGTPLRSQWELALLFTRDGFKRRSRSFSDMQRFPMVSSVARVHPAEKPVGLLRQMIEFGSDPDGLVLDTFCGSGSTGVAAVACGRRFIGIEIDPNYCKIARRRIHDQNAQLRLF